MSKFNYLLLVLFFISFSFLSCSNAANSQSMHEESEQENVIVNDDENLTLKQIISNRESKITWSREHEPERLTENIYSDEKYISTNVSLIPEVINIVYNTEDVNQAPVYPRIEGFVSLDLRTMPAGTNEIINKFCKALSDNIYAGPESFFEEKYYFNYVFFRNDLIENWKAKTGKKFPEVLDKDGKPTGTSGSLFSAWVLGKPFIAGEIIQQPVRFYYKGKDKSNKDNSDFLDLTLFIKLENKKIYQILEGVYGENNDQR